MSLKGQLLERIAETEQAEKELIASLAPQDRQRPGQADAWSPKDVLRYIAGWNHDLVTAWGVRRPPASPARLERSASVE